MADDAMKEQKWSCGCHQVDGKLVKQCTSASEQGEISAERHGVANPVSRKCFRLAELQDKSDAAKRKVQQQPASAKAAADLKTAQAEVKDAQQGVVQTSPPQPQAENAQARRAQDRQAADLDDSKS